MLWIHKDIAQSFAYYYSEYASSSLGKMQEEAWTCKHYRKLEEY